MDAKLQLWKQGEEASDASAKTVEAAAEGDQRAKRSRPSKQHALQQPLPLAWPEASAGAGASTWTCGRESTAPSLPRPVSTPLRTQPQHSKVAHAHSTSPPPPPSLPHTAAAFQQFHSQLRLFLRSFVRSSSHHHPPTPFEIAPKPPTWLRGCPPRHPSLHA